MSNLQVSLQCRTTECPCNAQPQNIPAVLNHQVSLQCPAPECPCSVQPPSVPSVPNPAVFLQCPWQHILAVPKPKVFLQCSLWPTEYSCSAQKQSIQPRSMSVMPMQRIPAVPKPTVFLQRSVARSPCGAQPLQGRTPQMLTFGDFANYKARLLCEPQRQGGGAKKLHAHLQQFSRYHCHTTLCNVLMLSHPILRETLHFLCNNGFRVGMLEVRIYILLHFPSPY